MQEGGAMTLHITNYHFSLYVETCLDIFATAHGLQGQIVCLQGFSDGVLYRHLDIVSVLIWREGETEGRPGLIDLLQGFLNDELLLGTVNNFTTSIHVVVKPKLQQVTKVELAVHDEVLACGLHMQLKSLVMRKCCA